MMHLSKKDTPGFVESFVREASKSVAGPYTVPDVSDRKATAAHLRSLLKAYEEMTILIDLCQRRVLHKTKGLMAPGVRAYDSRGVEYGFAVATGRSWALGSGSLGNTKHSWSDYKEDFYMSSVVHKTHMHKILESHANSTQGRFVITAHHLEVIKQMTKATKDSFSKDFMVCVDNFYVVSSQEGITFRNRWSYPKSQFMLRDSVIEACNRSKDLSRLMAEKVKTTAILTKAPNAGIAFVIMAEAQFVRRALSARIYKVWHEIRTMAARYPGFTGVGTKVSMDEAAVMRYYDGIALVAGVKPVSYKAAENADFAKIVPFTIRRLASIEIPEVKFHPFMVKDMGNKGCPSVLGSRAWKASRKELDEIVGKKFELLAGKARRGSEVVKAFSPGGMI